VFNSGLSWQHRSFHAIHHHCLTVLQHAIMNISNLCFTDPVFPLPVFSPRGYCFSNGIIADLSFGNQPYWCILVPPYWLVTTGDSRQVKKVDSRATVGLGNQIGGADLLADTIGTPCNSSEALCIWLHGWIALVGPVLPR
jgi:hypothetical protein